MEHRHIGVSAFKYGQQHLGSNSDVKWTLMWKALLLHLVAAVRAGETDDQLKFLGGVIHKLFLQGSFLGLGGPGESFIQVQHAVQTHGESDHMPANRSPHLTEGKEINSNNNAFIYNPWDTHVTFTVIWGVLRTFWDWESEIHSWVILCEIIHISETYLAKNKSNIFFLKKDINSHHGWIFTE